MKKRVELSPQLKSGVGRGITQTQILKIASLICIIAAFGFAMRTGFVIFTNHASGKNANPQVLGAQDRAVKSTGGPQFIEYQTKKGDTLFNISQAYNIGWTTLATINKLEAPFNLKSGQIIKIPKQ